MEREIVYRFEVDLLSQNIAEDNEVDRKWSEYAPMGCGSNIGHPEDDSGVPTATL
jgi:hypothetical protein